MLIPVAERDWQSGGSAFLFPTFFRNLGIPVSPFNPEVALSLFELDRIQSLDSIQHVRRSIRSTEQSHRVGVHVCLPGIQTAALPAKHLCVVDSLNELGYREKYG
jgi:hypothetical protein